MKEDKKKGANVPNLRFPGFEGEWEEKELGDFLEFKNGINASKEQYGKGIKFINVLDILNNDFITYEKITGSVNVSFDIAAKYPVNYGDILFQRSSETREEVGTANVYLDKKHTATFGGFVIRGRKVGEYDPIFLNKLLKTDKARNNITSRSGGSTRYNVGQETLSSIKLHFPTLSEQEIIASFLSLVDKRIEAQIKIIKQLETLIKGLYEEIFENEKYQFSVITLKSLCFIKKGEQINSSELSETGLYYVMNGGILPSGYHSEYNSDADTISISEGGNSCGYVQYNNTRFWSGGHCYTLNKIDNTIINKYLYHYLKANENKIMALRIGSGLPNIQKSTLEKFEVKIPNFYEQEKVVLTLDSFSNKLSVERKLFKMYQQQKQYFLQKLFI